VTHRSERLRSIELYCAAAEELRLLIEDMRSYAAQAADAELSAEVDNLHLDIVNAGKVAARVLAQADWNTHAGEGSE
jgi:hypothetical protein